MMLDRFVHNNREFKDRRKELRNNATEQEKKLWQYLKGKKLGCKFFRQHSIGPYIVDFYCAEKKLIVEIDGSQHSEKENALYDFERTRYFEDDGFKVLRFWNGEVDKSVYGVLEKIESNLLNLPRT